MDNNIIFSFPGNKRFAHDLANYLHIEEGKLIIKRFPDGESYVRINSAVKGKVVILFCPLNNPNNLYTIQDAFNKINITELIAINLQNLLREL